MTTAVQIPISGALGDYLEAVYVLAGKNDCVRITDISLYLNISKPSVNRAVNSLKQLGYVLHRPYGDITLTDAGREAGAALHGRHKLVKRFLMAALDMTEEDAGREAVSIEHSASQFVIDKMAEFVEHNNA